MATNENQVGVVAVFNITQFTINQKQYEELLKKSNAAATQSAEIQSKSINQVASSFRSAAVVVGGVIAGIVLGYKRLNDATKEFGDVQAAEQFDALSTAVSNLEDTVLAAGIEFNKNLGVLEIFTNIINTLSQVASIATGSLTFLANVAGRLPELLKAAGQGSDVFIAKLKEIQSQAKLAADNAFLSTVTAPQRSADTTRATEAEKEANKQRAQTANNIKAYIDKIRELQVKSGEDLLEAERDYQAKSAEAWASYIEKVDGIIAEGIAKRAELQRTYADAIASAERDYQRGAETAAYNHAKALADIERDYQNTIRQIQDTYAEDAQDAVRNLDALGLVRARERRDKDLANARIARDQANAAENENYQRQLFELQRALEDKKREAEQAYRRGLDDQRRAEQEALQDAKNEYNKQTNAARQAYNEKLTAIRAAYRQEDIEASAHYLNQETALIQHLQRMQAIMAQYGISTGAATGGISGGARPRANGGVDIVNSPSKFLVGEAGPELMITAPLGRAIPAGMSGTVNHIGDFSHTIDATINSSMAGIDGRIQAAVRKALAEVIR